MTQLEFAAGDTVDLPLSKLIMSKDNPRKTREKTADPALVASIRSRGLLQNLGVRPSGTRDGKFEVRFGGRRLLALRALEKEGHFGRDDVFSCKILSEDEAEADEAALSENISRVNMNPVDEFEAFRKLEAKGLGVAEIAMRFGITERQVAQRLALGGAAACVRKALRKGEISLDIARLFAGCPDVAKQERVFKAIDERGAFSPYAVKHRLYEGVATAKDDLVRFVTLEAYEAAGGAVEKDLFSDEVRLIDSELLYRLRDEKLQAAADGLRRDGWSWVETHEAASHDGLGRFTRIYGTPVEKTEAETSEIARLEAELDELEAAGAGDDEWSEEQWARYETLEDRLAELRQTQRVFSPEQKAVAGCIVYPGRDGVQIREGLVRKEDVKKAKALAADAQGDGAGDDDPDAGRPAYGAGLRSDLASFKAQALQAAIAGDPSTGVLAAQFILVRSIFADPYGDAPSGSTLSASAADLRAANGGLGETGAAAALANIEEGLPVDLVAGADMGAAWKAFRDLKEDQRDGLTALAFSRTIGPMGGAPGFMDLIAHETGVSIRRFWAPTGETFFSRLKKDQLAGFLKDCLGAQEAARLARDFRLKKSELVALCDDLAAGRKTVCDEARRRLDAWTPEGMAFDAPSLGSPGDARPVEGDSGAQAA
ncbi:ParB/RepB/Spo0J family partition protein [Hyphococcus sp.]|uniref:ParB/RepB/Spo0J family partition protein n=1 Tax=Hyphococcus sp. TaxID=2038636 RepID=UPI0035C70C73